MSHEIEQLVFKAYHGELSEAERDILTRWVSASPANAHQIVEYSVDAHSIEIALQNSRVANATSTNEMAMVGVEKLETTLGSSWLIDFRRAVAALLVITTLFALSLWLGPIQQVQENQEHVEFGVATPVGLSEAQILESTDLKWNRYTNHREDSETIVIPASGFLYHEFRGGGFILLEGPTTYQIEDDYAIRLIEGRLVAKADPAEPFTILVDRTRITIEEAEFGVQNIEDDVASAIVFEGSVEFSQNLSEGPSPVTAVKAGQIVMLPPNVGKADQLARATQADTTEYARLIDSVKLRPSHMASSVHFLADAPQSLLAGNLADRQNVRLFCERAGVSVNAGELTISPDRLTDFGEVPTDSLVDSYLLHFDPQVEGSKAGSWTTGMITFDRPIHGVLGSALTIRSTDALFGSTKTVYPRTSRAADGSKDTAHWGIEYGNDCFKLDDDGRTFYFRLEANQGIDQIRILVEARSPTQLSD